MKLHERVGGNVTLSYILRVLEKELKVKPNNKFQSTDYIKEFIAYNKNVINQISPLLNSFEREG
jgi:hypothetical protein